MELCTKLCSTTSELLNQHELSPVVKFPVSFDELETTSTTTVTSLPNGLPSGPSITADCATDSQVECTAHALSTTSPSCVVFPVDSSEHFPTSVDPADVRTNSTSPKSQAPPVPSPTAPNGTKDNTTTTVFDCLPTTINSGSALPSNNLQESDQILITQMDTFDYLVPTTQATCVPDTTVCLDKVPIFNDISNSLTIPSVSATSTAFLSLDVPPSEQPSSTSVSFLEESLIGSNQATVTPIVSLVPSEIVDVENLRPPTTSNVGLVCSSVPPLHESAPVFSSSSVTPLVNVNSDCAETYSSASVPFSGSSMKTNISSNSLPVLPNSFTDGLSALPPSLLSANLPPSFALTLMPTNSNGEFPAVQLPLPDIPAVILQVLPLPGAKMGEQYTINVPTPLILNGINSALTNSGTVNAGGGPIVLSIAPSGALPPPPPCSILESAYQTIQYQSNNPVTSVSTHASSVPVASVCLPSSILPAVVSTTGVAKRVRPIAPKPCHNLSSNTTTMTSYGMPSPLNRSGGKQRFTPLSCATTSLISLASVSAAAAVACSVASNSQAVTKSKKFSILPVSTSAVRSHRSRRKHGSNLSAVPLNQSALCYPTTTDSFITPSQATMQPPIVHPVPFTSQPLLLPNSSNSILSSSNLSQAFVFGGPLPPPGVGASGQPYILPQSFPFPAGCTPFPAPLYNATPALPSCTTSLPTPSTGPVPVIHSLPAGTTPTALVDPTTGLVTPYPNPCVPMAVSYSGAGVSDGSTTDQNAFGVSIVYSQSNPNTLGFLLPNGSQPNCSLVYPHLLPTSNFSEQSNLNPSNFQLSNYPSISSHLSTNGSAAAGPPNGLPMPVFPPGHYIPSVSSMDSNLSTTTLPGHSAALLYPPTNNDLPSDQSTSNEYLSSMSDLPKDDLISIAWRLTQMDESSRAETANYDRLSTNPQFYSSDIYGLHESELLDYEQPEIVLLDAKSSPSELPVQDRAILTTATSTTSSSASTETTGNADIDALLAAAAMVGAASGEGDAQSAVTIAVPCTLSTVTLPSQPIDQFAFSHSAAMTTLSSHTEMLCSTTSSSETTIYPPTHNPTSLGQHVSTPEELLTSTLLDDFSNSVCQTAFSRASDNDLLTAFDETDDATSLAAVLGCNADDAADLESVLNPTSDVSGVVSESFLNSLVNTAELELAGEGDVDVVDHDGGVPDDVDPIFRPDFEVCAPNSSPDDKGGHSIGTDDLDTEPIVHGETDDQLLLPSSHQVRCLLRNTVSSAMAYRLGSSTSRTDEQLFDSLFDTVPTKPSVCGSHRSARYSASDMPDTFLGVDEIEYTTAEQFDQALMLLGPPPTSPSEHSSVDEDNFMESDNLLKEDNHLLQAAASTEFSPVHMLSPNVNSLNEPESPSSVPCKSVEQYPIDVLASCKDDGTSSHMSSFNSDADKYDVNSQTLPNDQPSNTTSDLSDCTIPMNVPIGIEFSSTSYEDGEDTLAMCCPEELENESSTSAQSVTKAVESFTETDRDSPVKPERRRSQSFTLMPITTSSFISSTPNSLTQSNRHELGRRPRFLSLPGVHLSEAQQSLTVQTQGTNNVFTKDVVHAPQSKKSPSPVSIEPTSSCSDNPCSSSDPSNYRAYVDYSFISSTSTDQPSLPIASSQDLPTADSFSATPSASASISSDSAKQDNVYHSDGQSLQSSNLLEVFVSSALLEEASVPLDSESDDSPVKQSNSQDLVSLDRILKRCQKQTQQESATSLSADSKLSNSTVSTSSGRNSVSLENAGQSATSNFSPNVSSRTRSVKRKQHQMSNRKRRRKISKTKDSANQIISDQSNSEDHQPDASAPLLIPTSVRPLSFGFAASPLANVNPLLSNNFEPVLPRLNLASEGHLFPEWLLSSPTRNDAEETAAVTESFNLSPTITKSPHSYQLACESEPLPNQPVHSRSLEKPRRTRRAKLRGKKKNSRTRSSMPVSSTAESKSESRCSLPILIEPVNISIPSSNASFSRFVNTTDLPSFATVVREMEVTPSKLKSVRTPQWNSSFDHGVLFASSVPKSIDTSSDIRTTSPFTDNLMGDVNLPVKTDSTPLPITEISQSSMVASANLSTALSTPSSLSANDLHTPSTNSEKHWPPPPFADLQLSSKDLVKLNFETTTSLATTPTATGMTFGSFAGAAAFRSASFGALAAKAMCVSNTSTPIVPTSLPSFSDLAKQSNISWANPDASIQSSSTAHEQKEVDQHGNERAVISDDGSAINSPLLQQQSKPVVHDVSESSSIPPKSSQRRTIKSKNWRRKTRKFAPKKRLITKSSTSFKLDSSVSQPTPSNSTSPPKEDVSSTNPDYVEFSTTDEPEDLLGNNPDALFMDTTPTEVVVDSSMMPYEVIDVSEFEFDSFLPPEKVMVDEAADALAGETVPSTKDVSSTEVHSCSNSNPQSAQEQPDEIIDKQSVESPLVQHSIDVPDAQPMMSQGVPESDIVEKVQSVEPCNHPADDHPVRQSDDRQKTESESTTSNNFDESPPSEPVSHSPIRLRLNLKALVEKPRLILKKRIKHAPRIRSKPIPVEECSNPLVIVASSTPTSLSIRLKGLTANQPKPVEPIQPLTLSNHHDHHRKRKNLKRKLRSPIKRLKIINSMPPPSDSKDNDQSKINVLHSPLPIQQKDGKIKPIKFRFAKKKPKAKQVMDLTTAGLNRSTMSGHLTAANNNNYVPTHNPPVRPNVAAASIFSRKFFSTAKQERRSNYAQMSGPWRSGFPGSPRKRGALRQFSKPIQSTDPAPPTTKNLRLSSSGGARRRGRPPTRFRFADRINQQAVRDGEKVIIDQKCENSDYSGLRLVIRLGGMKNGICQSSRFPNQQQQIKSNSPAMIQPTVSPSPADDVDRFSTDESESSSVESQLDEMTMDSKSNSDCQQSTFDFFVATEAETYMDPHQVQIQRIQNTSASAGWNYYKRPTPPPAPSRRRDEDAVTNRSISRSNPVESSINQVHFPGPSIDPMDPELCGKNQSHPVNERPILDSTWSLSRLTPQRSSVTDPSLPQSFTDGNNPNTMYTNQLLTTNNKMVSPIPTHLSHKQQSHASPYAHSALHDDVPHRVSADVTSVVGDHRRLLSPGTQPKHLPQCSNPSTGNRTTTDLVATDWLSSPSTLTKETIVRQQQQQQQQHTLALAKTYYNQIASSFFDSFSNLDDRNQTSYDFPLPSSRQPVSPPPFGDVISDSRRPSAGDPLNQWPWCAPRPAHLPVDDSSHVPSDMESFLRSGRSTTHSRDLNTYTGSHGNNDRGGPPDYSRIGFGSMDRHINGW